MLQSYTDLIVRVARVVCRQNTIGSVEGELRNHEIREIQLDALLRLDRAAKNRAFNGSYEVVPKGMVFRSTGGHQLAFAWLIERPRRLLCGLFPAVPMI
jgi:hypothetical protein